MTIQTPVFVSTQPDDGKGDKLRDAFIKINERFQDIAALFQNKGDWATGTEYEPRDYIIEGGEAYVCTIAHTGGVFADDLAAGKWASVDALDLRADLASDAAGKGSALVAFKQAGTGAVPRTVDGKLKERVSVLDFGAVGDGVTDDTAALNAFLTACRAEKKPGFIPAGTYLTSAALDISGVELEGTLGGFENSEGTIIQGNGSHVVLNQAQSNVKNITYSIKNIRIKNGTVGLKMTYAIHCRIENVFITNCVDGVYLGDAALAGPLWCNFKNCRVVVSDTALKINGLAWANANIFDSCFFKGDVAGATVTAGGLGALANQFINMEFAGNGRGIVLGLNKSTSFDNTYFESLGPSIVIDGFTLGLAINGCTFALLKNTNADGVPAFIWHKSGTARFSVEGGWIYLSNATVHDNLSLLSSDVSSSCILTMFDAPTREIAAAGFRLFNSGLPTRNFVLSFSDDYTPVWTTSGTAPDIGDGTLSGRYSLNGRICTVQFELIAGSTTTFGTGQFQLSLPFPVANAGQRAQGMARIFESGVGQYVALIEVDANLSTMVFYPATTSTAIVSGTVPMTWSSGDSLRGTITYQVL